MTDDFDPHLVAQHLFREQGGLIDELHRAMAAEGKARADVIDQFQAGVPPATDLVEAWMNHLAEINKAMGALSRAGVVQGRQQTRVLGDRIGSATGRPDASTST